MMCQPMDQNINFSGSDQIQNPQYPDAQENSLTNDKFEAYTNANDANMNDLQFKLDNFQKNQQDFQEKFKQMQDDLLNQIRNFMQNLHDGLLIPPPGVDKEHEATTDTELPSTEDIQPLPEQEVKNVIEQPAEREKCNIQSLQNIRVIYKSSISFDTSQISSIHSIAPILSTKEPEHLLSIGECEVTLEDKKECDLPIYEKSPVCDNHSGTFFDSKIDDDILVYDDDFEDIEYVEASLSDPENVSIEEENSIEEEKCCSTRIRIEGDIYFLEELLIDDSILSHESSDFNFEENPSIPRPPPKPPDVETNIGEEIQVVMNGKDKFDDDYQFFMFAKEFSLLFAESEDTIFDPGISD
nr:hypothetical protein [Tanacetum cinerariifolium]